MERVVNRSDLISDESASSTSSDEESKPELSKPRDLIFVQANHADAFQAEQVQSSEEEEYEFRLFGGAAHAAKTHTAPSVHRVRLQSPSIAKSEPGFVHKEWNPQYYFAASLSTSGRERIESVALSGEQVLAQAKIPWPGSSYDWKLVRLPASSVPESVRIQTAQLFPRLGIDDVKSKRTRPGKKYRIKLRSRQVELQKKRSAAKDNVNMREAAEREKRSRRNREKKVKRRIREKAKKHTSTSSANEA